MCAQEQLVREVQGDAVGPASVEQQPGADDLRAGDQEEDCEQAECLAFGQEVLEDRHSATSSASRDSMRMDRANPREWHDSSHLVRV